MVREIPADAVMITLPVNRQYATTFRSSAGLCFVTKEGEGYFFTDFRYIEAATKAAGQAGYQVQMMQGSYAEEVKKLVQKHGVQTAGIRRPEHVCFGI